MNSPKAYVEKQTQGMVRLHANESPYNNFPRLLDLAYPTLLSTNINEYPSLKAYDVKAALGDMLCVSSDALLLGNGSDELITLVIQTLCKPNDIIVTHTPTFSQYAWSASLHHCKLIEVPDKEDYEIDIEGLITMVNEQHARLLIVCTPNNPTGALITKAAMAKIIDETSCYIMIDEAYIDFVDQDYKESVLQSPRLVTLRTFSKAFGLAGIRLGYAMAQPHLIALLHDHKQPYNVSTFTQIIAIQAIRELPLIKAQIQTLLTNKHEIINVLKGIGCMLAPSHANFIFFSHPNIESIEAHLALHGFAIKMFNHHALTPHCARMSIPHTEDTQKLIRVLKGVSR